MWRFLRRGRGAQAGAPDGGPESAGDGRRRLRLEVTEGPRSARMALYGEFDIDSAEDAGRALHELLGRDLDSVVVDVSGLDFIDSTGVRFLVDGSDEARAFGVNLSLVYGGDPVRRVLTISGVTALFEGQNDRDA
jgi:anti-sigma B factor antagonist